MPNKKLIAFALYSDDETLVCGGTLTKKIRGGYAAQVVVITDGSYAKQPANPIFLFDWLVSNQTRPLMLNPKIFLKTKRYLLSKNTLYGVEAI